MKTNKNQVGFALAGINIDVFNKTIYLSSQPINNLLLKQWHPDIIFERTREAQLIFPVKYLPDLIQQLRDYIARDNLNDYSFELGPDTINISFFRNSYNQPLITISSKQSQIDNIDFTDYLKKEFNLSFLIIVNYELTSFLINNLTQLYKNLKPIDKIC